MMEKKTLILGVGNLLLKDEGVGIHVIRALEKETLPAHVTLMDGGTGGLHLISWLTGYDHIIMVDATLDSNPPGTVRLICPKYASDYPPLMSAHEIGLRDMIETMILTGDLPTPIKYYNPEIKKAYKQVEAVSCEKLLALLPAELRPSYAPLLLESDEAVAVIVKAADKLSAYLKCVEELKAGNTEFTQAEKQTYQSLCDMKLPCLDYFMEHFLESFRLTLDELE